MGWGPRCVGFLLQVVLLEGHDPSFLWSGRLDLKLVRTGSKVLLPVLWRGGGVCRFGKFTPPPPLCSVKAFFDTNRLVTNAGPGGGKGGSFAFWPLGHASVGGGPLALGESTPQMGK